MWIGILMLAGAFGAFGLGAWLRYKNHRGWAQFCVACGLVLLIGGFITVKWPTQTTAKGKAPEDVQTEPGPAWVNPGGPPPLPASPGKQDGSGKGLIALTEQKLKDIGEVYYAAGQQGPQSYTVSKAVSKGWGIEKDNRGNAEIMFSIPGAPAIIETGLWCKGGQAFYVSTNSRHIPGFQAGFAEKKKFSPGTAPAWEYALPQGCRTRFAENDPTCKIELAFYTAAIPPGHYRVSVRHSGVALHPLEFQPGIPLERVYGY